jgi:hypothetical protein
MLEIINLISRSASDFGGCNTHTAIYGYTTNNPRHFYFRINNSRLGINSVNISIETIEIPNMFSEGIENHFCFLSQLRYEIKYATVYYLKTSFDQCSVSI